MHKQLIIWLENILDRQKLINEVVTKQIFDNISRQN